MKAGFTSVTFNCLKTKCLEKAIRHPWQPRKKEELPGSSLSCHPHCSSLKLQCSHLALAHLLQGLKQSVQSKSLISFFFPSGRYLHFVCIAFLRSELHHFWWLSACVAGPSGRFSSAVSSRAWAWPGCMPSAPNSSD